MAGLRRRRWRCIREAFSACSRSTKRRRRRAFFHSKFSEAHCSGSKDRSLHANYRMNFTSGERHRRAKPVQVQDMPEGLQDVFPVEDQQLVLTPGNAVLTARESYSDIHMAPENDSTTPMATTVQEKSALPTVLAESYGLSGKSGTSAETILPQEPECPSPMEIEPPGSVGFLETSVTAAPQQPPPPERDGDVCEQVAAPMRRELSREAAVSGGAGKPAARARRAGAGRRHRRRDGLGGQGTAEEAAVAMGWEATGREMKDSVKSSNCMERLAHKYMQKCVVESSTESESECSAEVLCSPLAEGLKKAKDSRGLQFLDPYDGDSEDSSIQSDCSLSSVNTIKAAPGVSSAPQAMALEDADPSADGEPFPKPLDWLCLETKTSEIHTQAIRGCKEPLKLRSLQKDFPRCLLQFSELTTATEAFPSMRQAPDPSLLVDVNPSASAEQLASPGDSSPQPMLADDCDGAMSKQPLIKRKQGVPISEGAGEKQRRKKIRAI